MRHIPLSPRPWLSVCMGGPAQGSCWTLFYSATGNLCLIRTVVFNMWFHFTVVRQSGFRKQVFSLYRKFKWFMTLNVWSLHPSLCDSASLSIHGRQRAYQSQEVCGLLWSGDAEAIRWVMSVLFVCLREHMHLCGICVPAREHVYLTCLTIWNPFCHSLSCTSGSCSDSEVGRSTPSPVSYSALVSRWKPSVLNLSHTYAYNRPAWL